MTTLMFSRAARRDQARSRLSEFDARSQPVGAAAWAAMILQRAYVTGGAGDDVLAASALAGCCSVAAAGDRSRAHALERALAAQLDVHVPQGTMGDALAHLAHLVRVLDGITHDREWAHDELGTSTSQEAVVEMLALVLFDIAAFAQLESCSATAV